MLVDLFLSALGLTIFVGEKLWVRLGKLNLEKVQTIRVKENITYENWSVTGQTMSMCAAVVFLLYSVSFMTDLGLCYERPCGSYSTCNLGKVTKG